MKLLKTIFALTALFFFTSTTAHAQHSFEGYSLDQLKSELNDAQIYQALGRAKVAADGTRGCYQYNNEMLNVRQSLINLTQQYEGRADSVYHQKRGELQEQFRLAQRGYEDCYNLTLADYPLLSYAGIRTLVDFKSKVGVLNPKFSDKADIAAYISAIENAIENLSQQRGKRVGVIESVFKTVEISRGGNGQWSPLAKGSTVHILDELRTGPRGRIRIQFEDRLSSSNAGPTVVNIGSDSHVKIEKFLISFNNPPKREGAISLLRGTVRAFTKNWGPHSQFSVRAGASVCGIRGTEVAVSYDPITYTATHVLDHGDAYLEAGNRQVQLTPRTSVTVVGDQMDWPVAVSEEAWSGIVDLTNLGESIVAGDKNLTQNTLEDVGLSNNRDLARAEPIANSPITLKEALETFRAFQYATIIKDERALLSLVTEPEKSHLREAIQKKGISNYAFSDKNMKNWVTDCAACFDDEKLGPVCLISDSRNILPKKSNKPAGAFIGVYTLKNENGISYISERTTTSSSYQVLRKKMKKNERICKFEALNLNLTDRNRLSEDFNEDGLSTLLQGIGSVLEQIK